jgi:hypothetical protein
MPAAFRTLLNPASGDTDPYFSSVSLLLHMDGTNGSTTFVDSGPNALAVTAAGNAQITTSGPKWGTGAADFDGNGDSLTIAANSVFAFGTGNFTIEGWFYSRTTGSSQRGMVDFRTTASGTNGIMLREDGTAGFLVGLNNGTLLSTATGRIANTWQHVALVRSGTTITLYVDGVSKASATSSANMTDNRFRLSGFVDVQDATFTYNGKIDDVRITKGIARWTSNFTPPTAAYPDLYNPYTTLPVSGAALWLSAPQTSSLYTDAGATNVIKDGDAVYQWNDLSGNSRHATQTTLANRPTWLPPAKGRNGLGAVAFNGSQWLSLGYSITGNFTIFVVYKNNDTVNGSVILGKSTGSPNYLFAASNSRIEMNGGGSQHANDPRTNGTQWDYSTFKYDGTNATAYSTDSSGTSTNVGSTSFTPDRIGFYSSSQFSMDGNIAEIIIYPSALSDTDRLSVRNYLKTKWGF